MDPLEKHRPPDLGRDICIPGFRRLKNVMYCMNHNEAQIYLHGSVSDERRGTELTDWGRRSHVLYVCKQGQALAIYQYQ